MSLFSYHLLKTSYLTSFTIFLFPPCSKKVKGLIHAECMFQMTLGAPLFSLSRILVRQVALLAQWESEEDLNNFLSNNKIGKTLSLGWHTRLLFVRQWGSIGNFIIEEPKHQIDFQNKPVVAITIARMRFLEIPRFIQWGRPVEKLVRDDPKSLLSLASLRFPRTVSTFSIWNSVEDMTNMVHGRSFVKNPDRHKLAMKERDRKDFHIEFTTLRFKPISEIGTWNGSQNILNLSNN